MNEDRAGEVVPIKVRDREIGCLVVDDGSRATWGAGTHRLLQAFVKEAAVALENARLFAEVQRLATLDSLTGLFNRRHFDAVANTELRRSIRYNLSLSGVMMDIDHFKRVNDAFGHATGDRVLIDVAAACVSGLRSSDLYARYGGEEFCFLLCETDATGAAAVAERLRRNVEDLRFGTGTDEFSVTASFGVAERSAETDSIDELLDRSDRALYEAKVGGRNRVVLFTGAA